MQYAICTSCWSLWTEAEKPWPNVCPDCGAKDQPRAVAHYGLSRIPGKWDVMVNWPVNTIFGPYPNQAEAFGDLETALRYWLYNKREGEKQRREKMEQTTETKIADSAIQSETTLRDIQAQIYEWSTRNFGEVPNSSFKEVDLSQVLGYIMTAGTIAHAALKLSQGIRDPEFQRRTLAIHGVRLEPTQGEYAYRMSSLLGVAEELGELVNAVLLNNPKLIKDGMGDILVFLLDWCSRNGYDAWECLTETWDHVKQRDWNRNKRTGGVADERVETSDDRP